MILLDLMLPKKTGEELLGELRKTKNTPAIVLSAKNEVINSIELLRLGADDYISKPFDVDEVILRIEAVLRRTGNVTAPSVLEYKNLKLDKDSKFVVFGDPKDVPYHAAQAVKCAVEMENAMDEVNAWNREMGYPELEMGIGINSGMAVVGNIGSEKKMIANIHCISWRERR